MNASSKYTFVLILLFVVMVARSQDKDYIDSLNKTLDTTSSSQLKADVLRELCYELTYLDVKKAYECGERSLSISNQTGYTHGTIEALNALSIIDKNQGAFSKSFIKLKSAVLLASDTKDSASLARTYLNIGDVYSQLQNYEKAIENYEKAYAINNKLKDYERCITNLSRIANRQMDIGNFRNDTSHIGIAITVYKRGLALAQKIHDLRKYTLMHVNLADAYNILGEKNKNKSMLFYAIDFSLRSLRLARENNFPDMAGISYLNMGESYDKLGNTFKAISYFEEALKVYQLTNNNNWLLNTHSYLAKEYFKLHNKEKAIFHTNTAIQMAQQNRMKRSLMDNFLLLSNIYKDEKEYGKSFDYYRQYENYKDSLQNEQTAITTARVQTELEMELKNKEIELLKQNTEIQNQKIKTQAVQRNFLIGIVILSLMLLIFVLYRYLENKKIQKKILRAKELAEQAKEMQEQFLANTSHEIRTPMNGIIGMTELLEATPLNKEQKEYLEAINESSKNLLVIINDLLDLSKINAGKMTFEHKPFRIAEQFRNITLSTRTRLQEKGLNMDYSIDQSIYPILIGDPTRLNQILLNLVSNAIKFTEKGAILLKAKLIEEKGQNINIEFSVSDTGIGIAEDKIGIIFESFSQVDSKKNKKFAGTGLGLAIVKQLVEKQGGKISVSSKPGRGSVFTFNLWFGKGIKQPEGKETNLQQTVPNIHSTNVLIVDDNKINQQVAALTLKKWNINSYTADSAQKAFEILKEKDIDIILMDVTMPEMDGFEATKHIRSAFSPPVSNIPIIAMTAAALTGDKERCISEGMNDYISKPFEPEELYEKIKKYLPATKANTLDLSLLEEKADGDTEYMKDIIQSYIDEMPVYLDELNSLIPQNNPVAIAKQAHKMKSPAALLGALELKDTLSLIEKEGIQGNTSIDYKALIKKVNILCLLSIDELKKKLTDL